MLAERGLSVHRESLAEMSDLLGLQARTTQANWSHRRWHPAEVELIARAFHLRQDWGFKPEVIRELLADGAECSERILMGLRAAMERFVAQAADVAHSRAPVGGAQPATSTAA
ncbi:MAG: hypothetical protein M3010_09110 [Candidatus Dormibacteraeota bacterium]|nr:hypothetical protein [Candidatus Dormibacteraeota bacterium]